MKENFPEETDIILFSIFGSYLKLAATFLCGGVLLSANGCYFRKGSFWMCYIKAECKCCGSEVK